MKDDNLNYIKAILKSNTNIWFTMILLILTIIIAATAVIPLDIFIFSSVIWLFGEGFLAFYVSQNERVQRYLRSKHFEKEKEFTKEREQSIIDKLSDTAKRGFAETSEKFEIIEKRASEITDEGISIGAFFERLDDYRKQYLLTLKDYDEMRNRDYSSQIKNLSNTLKEIDKEIKDENNFKVKEALISRKKIIAQHLIQCISSQSKIKEYEAQLDMVNDQLSLLEDGMYTYTSVDGLSSYVDNMMGNLKLAHEMTGNIEDTNEIERIINENTYQEDNSPNKHRTQGIRR